VMVKEVCLPDATVRAYPEYEVCKQIAAKKKIPLRRVFQRIEAAIEETYARGDARKT
jgi:uncharacterized protein (DUF111 family)